MRTLRRNTLCPVLLAGLAAVAWPQSGRAEAEVAEEGLPVAVTLSDGSRLRGTTPLRSVDLQTTYAELDLPLAKVARIRFDPRREQASFDLINGDTLTGVCFPPPLPLDMLFGRILVPFEHIRELRVFPKGRPGGLALHFTFEEEKGNEVEDRSGSGHHGVLVGEARRVETPGGQGVQITQPSSHVLVPAETLSVRGWSELTVAVRFRLDRYTTYGRVLSRGREGRGGGFGLSVGGVYGGRPYHGGFSVRLGPDQSVGDTVPRYAELGRWYQAVGVYDGETVRLYVDGKLVSSTDVPDKLRGKPLHEDDGTDLFIGRCATRRTWRDTHIVGVIDEVAIFDRALTEVEIGELHHTDGDGSRLEPPPPPPPHSWPRVMPRFPPEG